MAKILTIQEVKGILLNGRFDGLIGAVEDERLECKSSPYPLQERDHGKKAYYRQELAKDVCSMANSPEGGIILLGVQTEKVQTHFGDEITALRPFQQSFLDPKQYHDILDDWIYPRLQGVEISWHQSSSDHSRGLGAIIIAPQGVTNRPFLVTRTVTDDGKRVETVFGYVERRRANAQPLSVQELQVILREGLHYHNEMRLRLGSIEGTLQQIVQAQAQETIVLQHRDRQETLRARVATTLGEAGLQRGPMYILTACPSHELEVRDLFADERAGIVTLLANPPKLRRAGFNLDTGSWPQIVRGQFRRALSSGYKVLELWRDGTVIFATTGGADFLSWGRHTAESGPLRINSVALIESTYLFFLLCAQVFSQTRPLACKAEFVLELRHMTVSGRPCILSPGPTSALDFGFNTRSAPGPEGAFTLQWENSSTDPDAMAFSLIKEVYHWFGFTDSDIPYTRQTGDGRAIDPEQLRGL